MIRPLRQAEMLERARGCLLGQLASDTLGSLVEFQTPEQIRREYPNGVRELADGGTWNTIAGQPHVRRPRPECFRPVDALELVEGLIREIE